jgi:hypothetical protein
LIAGKEMSGMLLGNAKNPPTKQEPMQPEQEQLEPIQTELPLGLEEEDRKAWALDVVSIYRYRVSQRGPQSLEGRYGSKEWLEALEVLAQGWGRERAIEEITLVVACMLEEGMDEGLNRSLNAAEAWWLEDAGRRAVRDALEHEDPRPVVLRREEGV